MTFTCFLGFQQREIYVFQMLMCCQYKCLQRWLLFLTVVFWSLPGYSVIEFTFNHLIAVWGFWFKLFLSLWKIFGWKNGVEINKIVNLLFFENEEQITDRHINLRQTRKLLVLWKQKLPVGIPYHTLRKNFKNLVNLLKIVYSGYRYAMEV